MAEERQAMTMVWAILLVGMALLATFATCVLALLWRADHLYRKAHGVGNRGWLAQTMTIGSVLVLIPAWYFALTLSWRIVNGMAQLPGWMTALSAVMVIMALGSPVYLALRILTVRRSTGEPPPWDGA